MEAVAQKQQGEKIWFYEKRGQAKGRVSEEEVVNLIKNGILSHGSTVWKKGFPDWTKIENTELRAYLDDISPPPLTGEHVNNTIVWVLSFAPIIGSFLEHFIAGAIFHEDLDFAEAAVSSGKFWYISLFLNIALSFFDEKSLNKAGINTQKFKGWVWLVPVYLFQRTKALKDNYAYFIVWIVSFFFSIAVF